MSRRGTSVTNWRKSSAFAFRSLSEVFARSFHRQRNLAGGTEVEKPSWPLWASDFGRQIGGALQGVAHTDLNDRRILDAVAFRAQMIRTFVSPASVKVRAGEFLKMADKLKGSRCPASANSPLPF